MLNQPIQYQLVEFFTKGLYQDYIKMKLLPDNPRKFQRAVDKSLTEQNLRKKFRSVKDETVMGLLFLWGTDGSGPFMASKTLFPLL